MSVGRVLDSAARWVALAALGLGCAGCSCSDGAGVDGGEMRDVASRLDGAPADGWHPFLPSDGGPLAHEPCAERFEIRLIEWPADVSPPRGAGLELELAGRRDELAVLWRTCSDGEGDCAVGEKLAWASFATATGAPTARGEVELPTAYQPAFPSGVGWTDESWRVYFQAFGASDVQIGWLDVNELGASVPSLVGPRLSSTNTSEVVGSSLAMRVSVSDSPSALEYLTVREGVGRVHVVERSATPSSPPALSRDQRWLSFAGRTSDSSGSAAARLDLETEELISRELPADIVASGGWPRVVSIDGAGRVIVVTELYSGMPGNSPWRVRYLWLNEDLRVQGTWTSSREWSYPGNFQPAPVLSVGDGQLFIFSVDRELYVGLSRGPGSIDGATRALALLGSSDFDTGTRGWETWSYRSVAYAAIGFRSEISLIAVRCGM